MNKDLPPEQSDIIELDLPEEPEPAPEAEPEAPSPCPKCGRPRVEAARECPFCGIVYERVHGTTVPPRVSRTAPEPKPRPFNRKQLGEILFFVNPDASTAALIGRGALLLIITIWGIRLILAPIASNVAGASFLHLINLPFHEAGHVFFRPFGRFITSLGGSLGQLIVPMVCCLVLLFKTRDTFGAAVCFWWFGENLLDLAPYINDARSLTLPLVGGNTGQFAPYGFHDWQFILTESGLLKYDHLIAGMAKGVGTAVMLTAMVWAAWLLLKQYRYAKNPIRPTR